eukprot:6174710-Pleurochrysis_carterae.AAC.1
MECTRRSVRLREEPRVVRGSERERKRASAQATAAEQCLRPPPSLTRARRAMRDARCAIVAQVTQINELPSTTSLDVDYDSEFRRGSRRRVLSDLLAAPNEDSEAHVEVSLLRAQLEQVLKSTLTPQQRDVLRLRYGLDDGVAKTMRDVGAIAGLQPFTVRQLEKTALARLRRQKVQEQLKEFIPVDV